MYLSHRCKHLFDEMEKARGEVFLICHFKNMEQRI